MRAIRGGGLLLAFPWLAVPFGLYNAIAFTMTSASPREAFSQVLAQFTMISGAIWQLSYGDALTVLALALLFVEMLKATRSLSLTLIDRTLSGVLLLVCTVEFAVRKEAATSVFFLITFISFIEFIGGMTLTIRSSLRTSG